MKILLMCSAILVLLFAALSINVSRTRRRKRKFQNVSEQALTKAIRAHGNAAEYIPLFVALFLYFHSVGAGVYLEWIAVVATLSRLAHAAGMFLIPDVTHPHPLRFFGALATYACLFALGLALWQRVA